MDTETLQLVAASNRWSALLPEIILGCFAVLILFIDLLFPKLRPQLSRISIGVQLIAGTLLVMGMCANCSTDRFDVLFGGLLAQSTNGDWLRLFLLLSSIYITHIGSVFLKKPG